MFNKLISKKPYLVTIEIQDTGNDNNIVATMKVAVSAKFKMQAAHIARKRLRISTGTVIADKRKKS